MARIPDLYEVGALYIWRSSPDLQRELHGKETIVTDHAFQEWCLTHNCYHSYQQTDTNLGEGYICATAGDLICKNPPSGEKDTMDLIQHTINNPQLAEEN